MNTTTGTVSRIILGSCNSQHHEHQPLWPVVQSRNPTSFVWAGDAVYADDRKVEKQILDASPEYLKHLLQEQRNEPGYKSLLESGVEIFGTIDDHDYGTNNGDKTFRWRRENAIEFVNFLDLPDTSPMMKRAAAGLGVYGVQVYDFNEPNPRKRLLSDEAAGLDPDVVPDLDPSATQEPLSIGNRLVAVFVLDVRSNRTPWPKTLKEKVMNKNDGCMLGDEQFKWFETAIGRSNATVNIIVTGLQVHAERYYDSAKVENWNGFPKSQHRLYQALLQPNVRAPIVISGDVHHAQLLRKDCRQRGSNTLRPLYEVTTSGMTHSWGSVETSTCGRIRLGRLCNVTYMNHAKRFVLHFAHHIFPWNELIVDDDSNQMQYTLNLNVAELEFDWEDRQVFTRILGHKGQTILEQRWPFRSLTSIEETMVADRDFQSLSHRLQRQATIIDQDDWICVHYTGSPSPVSFAMASIATASLVSILLSAPLLIPILLLWLLLTKRRKRSSSKQKSE
ncbi:unnamed protein product [Cylindrotheca closterium]|uniref:PhoD-like phosphatase metallophosphatase domain-containing protein n=1 Tax=Cylindrotheca closterium TaxID=2856 RepID=A0AAD2FKX5_9STRA|nr:unnamed protein product [Cylindrotheca closterium]